MRRSLDTFKKNLERIKINIATSKVLSDIVHGNSIAYTKVGQPIIDFILITAETLYQITLQEKDYNLQCALFSFRLNQAIEYIFKINNLKNDFKVATSSYLNSTSYQPTCWLTIDEELVHTWVFERNEQGEVGKRSYGFAPTNDDQVGLTSFCADNPVVAINLITDDNTSLRKRISNWLKPD